MLDLKELKKMKKSSTLEVKSAKLGLPKSIWSTYSAMANTDGGIIVLGVKETSEGFKVVGIEKPDLMIKEIWNVLNNKEKVSVNLLTNKDIFIQEVEGKSVIIINVIKADREYKPVFIDNNPLSGTYRRNYEGDYHVSKEEYLLMVRDSSYISQDMKVLDYMGLDVFNYGSVRSFRQRMRVVRPGHVWEELDDEDFLLRISAISLGKDGLRHPTGAGLLMFGDEYNIVREFNNYFLDYQERYDENTRWSHRIISSSGEWSGNVYDFYFKVYNQLIQDLKIPFKMERSVRIDDTDVHKALREVLLNAVSNADYYGRQGIVVIKDRLKITVANPGDFRIDIDEAKSGGVSDPRNATILKMFNLIDMGERSGSGIPSIMTTWRKRGWQEISITTTKDPDRTIVELPFFEENTGFCESLIVGDKLKKIGDKSKKSAIKGDNGPKIGDKKPKINSMTKDMIYRYLSEHGASSTLEIAVAIGLSVSRTRDYLREMVKDKSIKSVGANRNRYYEL